VVINTVAAAVGPGHKVDLKNYDLLIIVEIYKVRFHVTPQLDHILKHAYTR
jgi:hypothetical protein